MGIKSGLIGLGAFGSTLASLLLATGCASQKENCMKKSTETDWDRINRAAYEKSMIPVALPQRDNIPFWNYCSWQFISPPAFPAKKIPGVKRYCFEIRNEAKELVASFEADDPQSPLTPVWSKVPSGFVFLSIFPLDKNGKAGKEIFTRRFCRFACFHGPYKFTKHDYREGAKRIFSYIYHLEHVQNWLNGGTVDDKVYRKYCYPSKTLPAIYQALRFYTQIDPSPEVRDRVAKITAKMADWLIENSCALGTPLEYLPPTYWKHASYPLAVKFIGQIMMIYPMTAGCLYLDAYDLTKDPKYLQSACRLADSMKRLQLPNGSWYLKLYEKDGKPVDPNIVVLNRSMHRFLTKLAELTGNNEYLRMRDRAVERILNYNLPHWDWDGQFEDVQPAPQYKNLTKDTALTAAYELLKKGETKKALQIIDWCEDQFVVWEQPPEAYPFAKNSNWRIPAGLEQYNCYLPIDSSSSQFIFAFCRAYRATGDKLYLEKAKALADNLLDIQKEDGSIQTWLFNTPPKGYVTWLNCMTFSGEALLFLDETIRLTSDKIPRSRKE